jgi:hypothetical protein
MSMAEVFAQRAFIKASNTDENDQFGASIAMSADGTTLVLGAPGEASAGGNQADNSIPGAGAVYVFTRTGATWVQRAYLKAPSPGMYQAFGSAVALSADGSILAATEPGVTSPPFSGVVHVFVRDAGAWALQDSLPYAGGIRSSSSLALSADGSTLAVGGFESFPTGFTDLVHLFTRSGASWIRRAPIEKPLPVEGPPGGLDLTFFGSALALSADGSTLAVGSDGESSAATGINGDQTNTSAHGAGAVFVYRRGGETWSEDAYLKSSNTRAEDAFGAVVSLADDGLTLAVGAVGDDLPVGGGWYIDTGAVFVFTRGGAGWTQHAYVTHEPLLSLTGFGASVALSGDGARLAVGIWKYSYSPYDPNPGSVLLLARGGTEWTQREHVRASNTRAGDAFGTNVVLSHDGAALAASALFEASAATGINGDQTDTSAFAAGAVYLFQ